MKPKYRCYDPETNSMVYGVGITPSNNNSMYGFEDSVPYYVEYYTDIESGKEFNKNTYYPKGILMQWTGLKDTHGKDIYEGDICRKPNGNIGVIKYYESWSNFVAGFYLSDDEVSVMVINPCQVIGNIHQNPELIQGVKNEN